MCYMVNISVRSPCQTGDRRRPGVSHSRTKGVEQSYSGYCDIRSDFAHLPAEIENISVPRIVSRHMIQTFQSTLKFFT